MPSLISSLDVMKVVLKTKGQACMPSPDNWGGRGLKVRVVIVLKIIAVIAVIAYIVAQGGGSGAY